MGGVAGLCIRVRDSGARSWILRVVVGGKRREVGLGGYPSVSLKEARERAQDARAEIRDGVDPVESRKAAKRALIHDQARQMTFSEAASLCHATKSPEFRNEKHRRDWMSSLNNHVIDEIGEVQISEMELPHIVQVLKPIWETKTETATRVRQRIESVLAWAKVNGYRTGDNPARWSGNLEFALPKPSKIRKRKNFPALHWTEVAEFMVDLKKRSGVGARALEFAILTAARSGEVRGATWAEFDLKAKTWRIPADRMKSGRSHTVPLSDDASKLLQKLDVIDGCDYVFPSTRGKKLSDMAMNQVTRRMRVNAVPHGFRSSFKDWARNSTESADEVSELALAHVSTDATRAAYARDELLSKRREMMDDWAEYCMTVLSE